MQIFIHAHYYLPKTLAGAEKFLHAIAKYLVSNGNKVMVSIDADEEYIHDGIGVTTNKRPIEPNYIWADAIITHLTNADQAINLAARFNKPIFHLLHNNYPPEALYNNPENNFIIYNSSALKDELNFQLPSIVARPYLDYDHWQNEPFAAKDHYYNEYITLVNCCPPKGVEILHRLADAMPGLRFMGVKGAYGNQMIQISQYRNIQYLPTQTDMRNVYDQTRIIIMPSDYESWGLVASEAMASGIPVICSDTPGLRENCGDAAIYAERQAQAYRRAIEELSDRDYYNELVLRGLRRNKKNDLDKILKFMKQNIKPEVLHTEELNHGFIDDEKEEHSNGKEKMEMEPEKEKKEIKKPGRPKKKIDYRFLTKEDYEFLSNNSLKMPWSNEISHG